MRAVCGDKPHVQFGRGGLVFLSDQDLAFYLTGRKRDNKVFFVKEGATLEREPELLSDDGKQGRYRRVRESAGTRDAKCSDNLRTHW